MPRAPPRPCDATDSDRERWLAELLDRVGLVTIGDALLLDPEAAATVVVVVLLLLLLLLAAAFCCLWRRCSHTAAEPTTTAPANKPAASMRLSLAIVQLMSVSITM